MATSSGGGTGSRRPGLYLEGLADLRRAIKKANAAAAKRITAVFRSLGRLVQGRAKSEARRFRDSGTLEQSLRLSSTTKKSSIYSDLVYAPVHEYGGTVAPRGVPIAVPRRQFLNHAVQNSRREIDGQLERLLDEIEAAWQA